VLQPGSYWDSENITESRLSFPVALDDPRYEQNDDNGLGDVHGPENEDALNQVLGSTPGATTVTC